MTSARRFSSYDDTWVMQKAVTDGQHREVIGGLWEQMGDLQLRFLCRQGLLPRHKLIDVGAGSFRAGIKLIPYLDPTNYYAIDIQASLLEAGYAREIVPLGMDRRFPKRNFTATADFDVSAFNQAFDFGMAQSVFTHMPVSRLADCLAALARHFRPGGTFYTTLFLVPDDAAERAFTHHPGGVTTTGEHDPFHTTRIALTALAGTIPDWTMTVIGAWDHPRAQQMVSFARRPGYALDGFRA